MLKAGAGVREGFSSSTDSSLPCLAILASPLRRVRNFLRSGWVSLFPALGHVCACLGISQLRPEEAQSSVLPDLITGGCRAKVARLQSSLRTVFGEMGVSKASITSQVLLRWAEAKWFCLEEFAFFLTLRCSTFCKDTGAPNPNCKKKKKSHLVITFIHS